MFGVSEHLLVLSFELRYFMFQLVNLVEVMTLFFLKLSSDIFHFLIMQLLDLSKNIEMGVHDLHERLVSFFFQDGYLMVHIFRIACLAWFRNYART